MSKFSVTCPECGTEFNVTVEKNTKSETMSFGSHKAKERIELLRKAGVNIDNLFAINGANGGEFVGRLENGELHIVQDNDPIFSSLTSYGTIPERRLFRRWIASQIMHFETMLNGAFSYKSVNAIIQSKGYMYMWDMIVKEFHDQARLAMNGDVENFNKRNNWFNQRLVMEMVASYLETLTSMIDQLPKRKCKGIEYVTISGLGHVFISDLYKKVYSPILQAKRAIDYADTPNSLAKAVALFRKKMVKMPWETKQHNEWLNAYKGMGAEATMENFVRFSNCGVYSSLGVRQGVNHSLSLIASSAKEYAAKGEGWRMYAMMRKFLADNHIDPKSKLKEWAEKKYK